VINPVAGVITGTVFGATTPIPRPKPPLVRQQGSLITVAVTVAETLPHRTIRIIQLPRRTRGNSKGRRPIRAALMLALKMRRGFSLIEVVISVALLVMVGMAMVILNATAVKLMAVNETTATAYGLNDRATGFVTAKRHQLTTGFDDYITGLPGQNCTTADGCDVYISCSAADLTKPAPPLGPARNR